MLRLLSALAASALAKTRNPIPHVVCNSNADCENGGGSGDATYTECV